MKFLDKLVNGIVKRGVDVFLYFHPAIRVMRRNIKLQGLGRSAEAIACLERFIGLEERDYADPKLPLKLESFKSKDLWFLRIAPLVGLLMALASERPADAHALLAADSGIRASDLREPLVVQTKLYQRIGPAPESVALLYRLAVALMARPAERLEILKMGLGIDPATPSNPNDLSAAIQKHLDAAPAELRAAYLGSFLGTLKEVGDRENALGLLEILIGQDDSSETASMDERARVERLLALRNNFPPLASMSWVHGIATMLLEIGHASLAASLIEAYLEGMGWGIREKPSRELRSLAGAHSETVGFLMLTLIAAQLAAGRGRQGIAVLSAGVGLSPGSAEGIRAAAAELRSRISDNEAITLLRALFLIITILLMNGYVRAAAELVEGFCRIDFGQQDMRELTRRLTVNVDNRSPEDRLLSLLLTIMVLGGLDELEHVHELVDAYVGQTAAPGMPAPRDLGPSMAGIIYSIWLLKAAQQDPERALEVCHSIVSGLRQDLVLSDTVVSEERRRYVQAATSLRGDLMLVAYQGASQESESPQARQRWLDLLAWDAELTERLLLERFFLEEVRSSPALEESPSPRWPFEDLNRPGSVGHLPDPGAALDAVILSRADARLSPEPESEGLPISLRSLLPELFETAGEVLRNGVDEAALARAIGRQGLFIRIFPTNSGGIRWYTVRSDGHRLTPGPHGAGGDLDQERLRWAALRHDFRATLARFESTTRGLKRGRIRRELEGPLRMIREAVKTYLRSQEEAKEAFDNILRSVVRALAGTGDPVSIDLLDRVTPLVARVPEIPDKRVPWCDLVLDHLSGLLVALVEPADLGPHERLNSITQDLLEEVHAIWPLDSLAPFCTPETDVVFHISDALHAVPLAHLPVAGEPLYRRVRSVRNSFSLLLGLLQKETEERLDERTPDDGGLLCVSYFEPDDPAWTSAVWLHHGQLNLAQAHGLSCHTAAENPAGSSALIRAALRSRRSFRALTVCGHGSRSRPGVLLADGLWQGGGADLSRVDWLLMVSCSLGRVAQTGDQDAEGFCVQLAMHRALSVLACRWPVGAVEAVAFANEALRQYLLLGERARREPGFDRENLRARAVNRARRALLDGEDGGPGQIGLDTAAAFELYGLG